jgi:hypothetical protein
MPILYLSPVVKSTIQYIPPGSVLVHLLAGTIWIALACSSAVYFLSEKKYAGPPVGCLVQRKLTASRLASFAFSQWDKCSFLAPMRFGILDTRIRS